MDVMINKTKIIVERYVGRTLGFFDEFVLSVADRIELLLDIEETYNMDLNAAQQKQFNNCNTIQAIEDLLMKVKLRRGEMLTNHF